MNKSLGRILAEKDLRALSVVSSGQSEGAIKETRDRLVIEMEGKEEVAQGPEIASDERDQEGFEALKLLIM